MQETWERAYINCITHMMKSKGCIIRSKMWKSRQTLGFWGQIEFGPKPPVSAAWTTFCTSPGSHSCWGPHFELTAGGLQHPLTQSFPFSPPLPQTFQTVTIAWRGLLRGLKHPTAAAQLVNGSTQADHLRAPGVDLWRAAHVSCCLLHSQRITKEKATKTHETEQKMESNKTRNFQGDPFY